MLMEATGLSQNDKGKIAMAICFILLGCALLYYVIYALAKKKVYFMSKYSANSGFIVRNEEPGWYWFWVLFYLAISLVLIFVDAYGIYFVLTHKDMQ
jgi:hypothetical protein